MRRELRELGVRRQRPRHLRGRRYGDHDPVFQQSATRRAWRPSTLQADGAFGPAALVRELSSPFRDTRVAIRRDGLEIFLSTGRPGGVGSEDIWVSTRATTLDPWSPPVPLGPVVNSPSFDGGPALSFDGTELYFHSDRPGGFGGYDLYVTRRARLRGPDVAEGAAVESHEKAKARERKEADKKEE